MEKIKSRKSLSTVSLSAAVNIALFVAMVVISSIVLVTSAPMMTNFGEKTNPYLFVIGTSAIFMAEMLIPYAAAKVFKVKLPPIISVVFVLHCFAGSYLGNVANLYYLIPNLDNITHFIVGVNTSMLGLALIQFFNCDTNGGTSPLAVALFALFTGVALGACWEVFEFSADVLFDINMQRYAHEATGFFIGQAALMDTMTDIVLDLAGAIAVAIPAYISLKRGLGWHRHCVITKKENTINTSGIMIHQ